MQSQKGNDKIIKKGIGYYLMPFLFWPKIKLLLR